MRASDQPASLLYVFQTTGVPLHDLRPGIIEPIDLGIMPRFQHFQTMVLHFHRSNTRDQSTDLFRILRSVPELRYLSISLGGDIQSSLDYFHLEYLAGAYMLNLASVTFFRLCLSDEKLPTLLRIHAKTLAWVRLERIDLIIEGNLTLYFEETQRLLHSHFPQIQAAEGSNSYILDTCIVLYVLSEWVYAAAL